MTDYDHARHDTSVPKGSFWTSRTFFVCLAFLAIAGFLLVSEHRVHALGALPFLLLLACPLMHVFMHGRHGGHGSHDDTTKSENESKGGRS